jgi:phosphoserine phosphatase
MTTFGDERTTYFDVDGTLLEWDFCEANDTNAVELEHNGEIFYKKMIPGNVKEVMNHYFSGNTIVVWSAGGGAWAAKVVKALKIEKYVHCTLTKPDFYFDDKDVAEWFPPQRYFEH